MSASDWIIEDEPTKGQQHGDWVIESTPASDLVRRGGTAAGVPPVAPLTTPLDVQRMEQERRGQSFRPLIKRTSGMAAGGQGLGPIVEGGMKITEGARQMPGPLEYNPPKAYKAGTHILRGVGEAGSVAVPGLLKAAPVETAAAFGLGEGARWASNWAMEKMGTAPEKREFVSEAAAMLPWVGAAKAAVSRYNRPPLPHGSPPAPPVEAGPPRPNLPPREGPLPPVVPVEAAPAAVGPKRPRRPTPVQMEEMGVPPGKAPVVRRRSRQTPEQRVEKLRAQLAREKTARVLTEPASQGKEVIPQATPEVPPAGRAPITPDDIVAAVREIDPKMLVTNRQIAEKFPGVEPQQLQGPILEAAKRGDVVLNETSAPAQEQGFVIPIGKHPDGTPKFASGLALKAKQLASKAKQLASDETGAIQLPGGRSPAQSIGEEAAYHLTDLRERARLGAQPTMNERLQNVLRKAKTKLVDSLSPIEDTIAKGEQKFGLPNLWAGGFTEKADRALRSQTIADERFDRELGPIIRDVDNIEFADQYKISLQSMAAKYGITEPQQILAAANAGALPAKPRIKTGRTDAIDLAIIRDIGPKAADASGRTYHDVAKATAGMTNSLMDVGVESGLISPRLAAYLKRTYPYYTDMHRVFTEAEALNHVVGRGGGGPANLTAQSVYQILKGNAKREVENTFYSLASKYRETMREATKNDASRATIESLQRIQKEAVAAGAGSSEWGQLAFRATSSAKLGKLPADKGVISFLDRGKRQNWIVPKELADAAKSVNREQLGVLEKISANFVRVYKMGTTGIRLPFAFANLGRDVAAAYIQSDRSVSLGGVLLPPKEALGAIGEAVAAALGHTGRYSELVQRGVLGTNTFDLYRNNPARTVQQIRSYRSAPARILYTVRHPGELIRATENIVGRTEELTRAINTFAVDRAQRAKAGIGPMTAAQAADAEAMANQAGRKWTTDFLRGGDYRPVMQALAPYLSAGIQGTRTQLRSWQRDPVATGVRTIAAVVLPTMAATLYNLSDPDRAKAYFDAQETAQGGWITFFPGKPTKDKQGAWNAIKIPVDRAAQPIAQLTRHIVEQLTGNNPRTAAQWFKELFNTGLGLVSPIDPDEQGGLVEKVVPQIVKGPVEVELNKDLRTGRPVNPEHLKDAPSSEQAWRYNRGTSKMIARGIENIPAIPNKFKTPAAIEHLARSYMGPLATDVLSASDWYLDKAGVLPPGESRSKGPIPGAAETIQRFTKTQGGRLDDEAIAAYEKAKLPESKERFAAVHAARGIFDRLNAIPDPQARLAAFDNLNLKKEDPVTKELARLLGRAGKEAQGLAPTRAESHMRGLSEVGFPKAKASQFVKQIKAAKTADERVALIDRWKANGLLTKPVQEEMARLLGIQ